MREEHRGRFSVSGVWPGRMGPARPQTLRQRFSTPAPRSGERAVAGKRRFPPVCTQGTGCGRMPRWRRKKYSVTGVGPGRMGPARPQTPRQRFSTPAPRFGERAVADRRRFPPVCTRGTGCGRMPRWRRKKYSVSGIWPGRMGPARPQTPRQRFSTPAPRFGERAVADRRRFPPVCTRGTGCGRMPRSIRKFLIIRR